MQDVQSVFRPTAAAVGSSWSTQWSEGVRMDTVVPGRKPSIQQACETNGRGEPGAPVIVQITGPSLTPNAVVLVAASNLVSNSFKYCSNCVEVSVGRVTGSTGRPHVKISVQDDGQGASNNCTSALWLCCNTNFDFFMLAHGRRKIGFTLHVFAQTY